MYEYTGRSIAGLNSLKQQNAVIELHSRVAVQAQDETTIIVKVMQYSYWWLKLTQVDPNGLNHSQLVDKLPNHP